MSGIKPPTIPHTPSKTINEMLQSRFSAPIDNIVKLCLGHFVCFVFTAVLGVYRLLKRGDTTPDSQRMWTAACAVVAVAVVVACFIIYVLLLATSSILHLAVYYGLIALALLGIGIAVSGAIFFDKKAPPPGEVSGEHRSDQTLGYGSYKPGKAE